MLSLEQKQALLVKKWEALHKPPAINKPVPAAAAIVPMKNIDRLASAIWAASGRDLKSLLPPGVKNSNWCLLNLIGKIEWYGNVAVGRNRDLEGWWDVVPPTGGSICFVGINAEAKAHMMAQKIQNQYL